MKPRRDKFKAICLLFFAFAVLDAWKAQRKAQQGLDEPTADSAVGVYLEVIARCFVAFDWTKRAIVADTDGTT